LEAKPLEILNFWFVETPRDKHYSNDQAFDALIRERFEELWRDGRAGRLGDWEVTPEGALALVILLDQFPRNMFRGQGEAFSSDAMALGAAKRAVARGFDEKVPGERQSFFYMPYMHSENLADQEECLRLFGKKNGEKAENSFAVRHRDAIARFGRFPARNDALGRQSTEEEAAYLKTNPAGF